MCHALRLSACIVLLVGLTRGVLGADEAENLAAQGIALAEAGRLSDAEAAFRKAATLRPDVAPYRFRLAGVLLAQKKCAEAEKAYRQGLELDGSDANQWNCLGTACWEQRKYPEAAEAHRQAIRAAPNDGRSHANLAGALLALGQREEAVAEARVGLRLGFHDHWIYKELGIPTEAPAAQGAGNVQPAPAPAAPDQAAKATASATPGEEPLAPLDGAFGPAAAWHGSIMGEWDFGISKPRAEGDGTVFKCLAWDRTGAQPDQRGTMAILLAGRKVKMRMALGEGRRPVTFDGVFSPDGRFISGRAYEMSEDGEIPLESFWWATVDVQPPAGPPPIHINTASVGAIAAQLDRPRDAWAVFEHFLLNGPCKQVQDLDNVWGLDPRSLAQLKERADVR